MSSETDWIGELVTALAEGRMRGMEAPYIVVTSRCRCGMPSSDGGTMRMRPGGTFAGIPVVAGLVPGNGCHGILWQEMRA